MMCSLADLVVVRLGALSIESYAASGFSDALALLIEAGAKAPNALGPKFDTRVHTGQPSETKI